jgi:1,2-diacylglycerol 3-alpha-glucosyltransferase
MIVGEGPAQHHLERLGERLGLGQNLFFVGYLDRERELLDCYRAGDVFVFASRTETQGLVLLESMALGVPVVALAEMGTRDILGPARGALVAENDSGDFAEKVLRLLREPDLRAELSADARVYAETWSAPALAQRLLDLYRSLAREAA